MDQNIDPTIKALASTIGEIETGAATPDAYTKKGASGEYGRYQFMPKTYANYAQKYVGDAKAPPTMENQNKIVYSFIKEKKDAGYNPAQIMSMWNAGEGRPDAYKQNWKGVNSQGVSYDTPGYVQRGSKLYQQKKAQMMGGMAAPLTPQDNSFGKDVGDTVKKAGDKLSGAIGDTLSGKINPLSGVIQSAGAVAGGLTGVVGNALEHTPVIGGVVKGAENLIGQGAQALAQTQPGQAAVQGYGRFAQAHPELYADIGAGVDIAGLVGGGFQGALAKGALVRGAENAATKGFVSASTGSFGKTLGNAVDKAAVNTASKLLESGLTMNTVKAAVRGGKTAGAEIAPDAFKQKSIQEVANLVKDGTLPRKISSSDAAPVIKKVADSEAESMRQLIRSQDIQPTLQPETLSDMAQRVTQRAGESLVTGDKPAETLLKVFYDNLPKGRDIVAEDILNARQALYRFMESNKGDYSTRGVLTGYKSARNAIVDESRALLKELAPNVDIEGSLAKQSALYQALDYIIPSVKKEVVAKAKGMTGKGSFVKGLVKAGAKYAAEGAGLGGVLHLLGE